MGGYASEILPCPSDTRYILAIAPVVCGVLISGKHLEPGGRKCISRRGLPLEDAVGITTHSSPSNSFPANYTATMVALSHLALALAAAVPSLAAPSDKSAGIQKRGPMNFNLGPDHPLALAKRNETAMRRRQSSTNYEQDYETGGDVYFAPASGEFYITWDVEEDFVCGVGWKPGTADPITHAGSFDVTSGLASLSVYGWTTDPLVEYYVIDYEVGMDQAGTQLGTFESDGATYAIWENQRVNEPSIEGTSTFNQYISIRSSGTASGTVTLQNHFDAWANVGLTLGTFDFQVIAVESWSGAGEAYQTVEN
ncbi:concanavalin A-like lectin/glucanase domain-containing protein [Xylariomycetidae sp. FL0641]|nr:concanavalin A-like lectin/glucanase domain-containing protein [Xylariomycetidae sp. FL0641]